MSDSVMFGGRISALFRFQLPKYDVLPVELEAAKKELEKAHQKLELRTAVIIRKADTFEQVVREMRGESDN